MNFRKLASTNFVEIQHSHHRMSITKIATPIIQVPFEIICIAIHTCDVAPIMKLIMPTDTVLIQSNLPINMIKLVTANIIRDFLNML